MCILEVGNVCFSENFVNILNTLTLGEGGDFYCILLVSSDLGLPRFFWETRE